MKKVELYNYYATMPRKCIFQVVGINDEEICIKWIEDPRNRLNIPIDRFMKDLNTNRYVEMGW